MDNRASAVPWRYLLGSLVVVFFAAAGLWWLDREDTPPTHNLIFGGDVMLGRDVELWQNQGITPLAAIQDVLAGAEISVVNLESPFTHSLQSVEKEIVLKAKTSRVDVLQSAGVDVALLANNHQFDYGLEGHQDTVDVLNRAGIAHTGAGLNVEQATTPVVVEAEGHTVALLAFSRWDTETVPAADTSLPGQAFFGHPSTRVRIGQARASADLVVVSLHFGREYEPVAAEEQKRFAQQAIEFGADVVIGHHPHVSQPVEIYHGRPIFYSLGNLVFDQDGPEQNRSFLVGLDISAEQLAFTLHTYTITQGEVQLMSPKEGIEFLTEWKSRTKSNPTAIGSDGTGFFAVDWFSP